MEDPRELVGLELTACDLEDLRVAEEELRETPDLVKDAVKELVHIIEEDGSLNVPTREDFLLRFLRPTKFYPKSAFKLLKAALEFRDSNKQLIGNLMPEDEAKSFLTTEACNVLVRRDAKGRRVMVIFPGTRWNPDTLSTDQIFRIFYLIHLAALLEPRTQIHGGIVILDFRGLSMKHVRALGPTFAFRLLTFCQDALPLRLKAVHILHQPFIFNLIWNIFKPFIKEKLRRRMFFHGSNLDPFYGMISKDDLPEDFGGNQPAINYTAADWYPVFCDIEDTIRERFFFRGGFGAGWATETPEEPRVPEGHGQEDGMLTTC